MIDERSTERYTETKDANHDLVTKSFLKKFADKSKDIFRAALFDCENYGNLTIVTNVKHENKGFEPKTYIIDIKDSNTYDTTITWDIYADDEKMQNFSVHVLCKGDPTPVHICKYEKEDGWYYTFIIEITSGKLVTVDVTELRERKNNIEQWNVYPSNGILYESDGDVVWLTNNIKDSIYLLQGEGTQESPYEENLKHLDCDEFSLDGYTELGTTAYNEILYVKGDIPEQKYFNGNLIESGSDISVTGIKFKLVKYIYYQNGLLEGISETYFDKGSFTTSLKQLESCLKYYSFKDIDVNSKNYNDLDELQETSIEDCLISEVNNTFDVLPGVFDSTRALLAKESDHSKKSIHAIKSDHSITSDCFNEEKLINLQTDDFLKYSEESFSTDFSDTTNVPKLNFQGSNLQNIEEGKFYNNVKVNKLGLIVEANNISLPSGLPYEKNTDDLYFRIDPDKSIDADNVLSTQNITFAEFVSNLTIVGEFPSNDVYKKKKVATITNNSGKDLECSFFTVSNAPSRILDMETNDSGFIPNNGVFTLITQDEKYIGTWYVSTNGSASPGYIQNKSYFTLFNGNEDNTPFVNNNGATCYYQWREITIPTGSTNIYIKPEFNINFWTFNGVAMQFYENCTSEYENYFKQFNGGADPYVKIKSPKNLVIIGNDGLKISCGNNLYKILITADGIIAG